jgi:hypothetical protein
MSRFPPPLTGRQGKFPYPTRNFALALPDVVRRMARPCCAPSLHVAMQMGPSLHPMSRASGVWPLRILISSRLGFCWFMV